jgi:hypothetical protein
LPVKKKKMSSDDNSRTDSHESSQEDEKDLNDSEQENLEKNSVEENGSHSGKPFGWLLVKDNKACVLKAIGNMPKELEIKSFK